MDRGCVPSCSKGCINGNCSALNTCDCSIGWSGSDCSVHHLQADSNTR
jgi:hypothetical protein